MFGDLITETSTNDDYQQDCSAIVDLIVKQVILQSGFLTQTECKFLFDWIVSHSGERVNSVEECVNWLRSLPASRAAHEGLLITSEIFWLMKRRFYAQNSKVFID
jgi:hypothetical protein